MTPPNKLSAAQARALIAAEVGFEKLKAAIDAAKIKRAELRARYKLRIPPSTDPKDAGKDVRQVEVGGFRIRVSTFAGRETFSLSEYRKAGHPITDEMAPFVGSGEQVERWTWKDLRGPKSPDAVEPTS